MHGVEVVRRCGAGDLRAIRGRLKCERCGIKEAQLWSAACLAVSIAFSPNRAVGFIDCLNEVPEAGRFVNRPSAPKTRSESTEVLVG